VKSEAVTYSVGGASHQGQLIYDESKTGLPLLLIDRLHQRNSEMAIKRDMLERGLSVDEIERVLAANL